MEFKFPVVKADGKEYTAEELYGLLADEDSGYYLLSANQFWHGGVHFTDKKFPQCMNDVPIKAIADGKVVAYRLNDVYEYVEQTVSPTGETLKEPIKHQYSTGFCLIKHEYEIKKSEAQKKQEADAEKQQEAQQRLQQTTSQLNGQQTTIKGGSRNRYSVTDGKVGAKNGTFADGTKLNIISVNETLHGDYYYAKVQQENTTEEFFIALLDKEGNPLKSGGNPFFDMPQAATPNIPTQSATAQSTNNDQPSNTDDNKTKKNKDSYKLTFYSLYMHLSAYEDYLPKKGVEQQIQKQTFTIKATDLNVREKFRGEGGQTIGYISDGATIEAEINADTLRTTNKITDLKATIKSGNVTKDSTIVKQVGDVIWVPIQSGNNHYIVEALPQLPTPPIEKQRPAYWQGNIIASVNTASKDQKNRSGLELFQTEDHIKSGLNPLAILNSSTSNQFTFDSTQTQLILRADGTTALIGKCTPLAPTNLCYTNIATLPASDPAFYTTVDTDQSITIERIEPSKFNTVVNCDVKIKAGDVVGYLGLYETPTQTGEQKSKRQVHIEVFIAKKDDVNFLLENPLKLTDGRQFIKLNKGDTLHQATLAQENTNNSTTNSDDTIADRAFSDSLTDQDRALIATKTTEAILQDDLKNNGNKYQLKRNHAFPMDSINTEKDDTGKEYYTIAAEKHTGKVEKTEESPKIVNQHEWKELGFEVVEETSPDSDGYLDLDQMPQIFKDLYNQINKNGDEKLEVSELQAALKDPDLREQWSKFIGHHLSEWKKDASAIEKRFEKLLTNEKMPPEKQLWSKDLLKQEKERIKKLTFLDEVTSAIDGIPMLYHFHPVAFVEYLKNEMSIYSTYDKRYKAKDNEVYINIITPKTRNLEGPLIIFDKNGVLFKTHSLCRGSNSNRTRASGNGDTPTGRATTSYSPKAHNGDVSYGNSGLIYLVGESGEFLTATRNGRAGIAIHCGHTTGYGRSIVDTGKLMGTHGCVRVYNSAMRDLGALYTKLKGDGKKIYCYIEDYDGDIKDVYKHYGFDPDPKDTPPRSARSNTQ